MTVVARELKASFAFIERNLNLNKRYWGWELAWLVYGVAGALSITLIGADQQNPRLLLTLLIGAIFWNYLGIVFEIISDTITWERWEGTLEYTMMAPVRRISHLFGMALYAVLYALVYTSFVLLVLTLFFGLDLSRANLGTAAAFMLIGSLSFIGIGFMAAILPLIYVERGAQMTFVLQSLLLLFSGVYYSIDVLPGWMQAVAHFSPGTYVLDGVRRGLIDGVPVTALLNDVWPLVVMAIILIPLGVWAFSQAEKYAKRTGKLKRVG